MKKTARAKPKANAAAPPPKAAPRPAKALSPEAKAWAGQLIEEFTIDDAAGLMLVQLAAEALDTMRAAQTEIERDGLTVLDRFSQRKQHPSVLVERDARTAVQRSLKALNLDITPPNTALGRPPGR
jgi:hypothetical protein